jgi:hypothetical protein
MAGQYHDDLPYLRKRKDKKDPPEMGDRLDDAKQAKWFKTLGDAAYVVGLVTEYRGYRDDGDSASRAVAKAVVINGLEIAGTRAGAAAGVACGPLEPVCSVVLADLGGRLGKYIGKGLFDPPGPYSDPAMMPEMVGP